MLEETSEIVKFYQNKTILLTGATGFVGKIVAENLLRKCDVKKIYLVIRPKKGVNSSQRLEELFKSQAFDLVKKLKPDYKSRVELVDGDLSLPFLGLSESAKEKLMANSEVVIHGAATVRFDETIQRAVLANVRATRDLCLLCQKMPNFVSFVYVSTAYCHSQKLDVQEIVYDNLYRGDEMIKLCETLNDELLPITQKIIGDWPNTYTFTKAMAEEVVKTYGSGLSISLFRPAIISPARSEPIPGWTDDMYGPANSWALSALGLVKAWCVDADENIFVVPIDMTVNGILAAGYQTAKKGSGEVCVYNYLSPPSNMTTVSLLRDVCTDVLTKVCPLSRGVWFPTLFFTNCWPLYFMYTFLVETLPAFFCDFLLMIIGKKPMFVKICSKFHGYMVLVGDSFLNNNFKFDLRNIQALWEELSPRDRELFDFNLGEISWKSYLPIMMKGMRVFILKDPMSTVKKAQRRLFWLYIIHRGTQALFLFGVVWLIRRTL